MDFNPCMKHSAIRKAVRKFAEEVVEPRAAGIDETAEFDMDTARKMAEEHMVDISRVVSLANRNAFKRRLPDIAPLGKLDLPAELEVVE